VKQPTASNRQDQAELTPLLKRRPASWWQAMRKRRIESRCAASSTDDNGACEKANEGGYGPRENGEPGEGSYENGVERVQRGIENVADAGDIDARVSGIGMIAMHEKDDGVSRSGARDEGMDRVRWWFGIARR